MHRILILIERAQRIKAGLKTGSQMAKAGGRVDIFFLAFDSSALTLDHVHDLETIRRYGGNGYSIDAHRPDQTGMMHVSLEAAAEMIKDADTVLTF